MINFRLAPRTPPHVRRFAFVPLALVIGFLLATITPGPVRSQRPDSTPPATALLVTWQTADGDTFRAIVTDPPSIERIIAARAGDGYAGIPLGSLARGDGGVNAPHLWHMVDVNVVDITIELCDGTASMVDADIDYWVDVVGRFCPWSAVVIAAEPVAPGGPSPIEPTPTDLPALPPVESPSERPTSPVEPPTESTMPALPTVTETIASPLTDPPTPSMVADDLGADTPPPPPPPPALMLPNTGTGPRTVEPAVPSFTWVASAVILVVFFSSRVARRRTT